MTSEIIIIIIIITVFNYCCVHYSEARGALHSTLVKKNHLSVGIRVYRAKIKYGVNVDE